MKRPGAHCALCTAQAIGSVCHAVHRSVGSYMVHVPDRLDCCPCKAAVWRAIMGMERAC